MRDDGYVPWNRLAVTVLPRWLPDNEVHAFNSALEPLYQSPISYE